MGYREEHILQVMDKLHYDFSLFSISDFVNHLETIRQREIILRPYPFSAKFHGAWVRAETADYIFFDKNTHEIHRIHHILHELGHIVLGHRPRDLESVLSPAFFAQLKTAIAAPLQVHCRTWMQNNTIEEQEAELFVRLLQHKVMIAGRLATLTNPVTSIDELTRFTKSLGYDD